MSLQHRTEAELLDEIDVLKEQVAYWRSEAMIVVETKAIGRLQSRFGLTPNQARMLATLHTAAGDVVRDARLLPPSATGRERENEINLVKVMVCKLRGRVGADAIENVWGIGYRLTDKGISMCRAALAPAS